MLSLCANTIEHFPTLRASGLSHRRSTAGIEKDLVDSFIETNLTPAPAGQFRLIFVEPRLEIGFPDLVVVYIDAAAANEWNSLRGQLGKCEICVLHHLTTAGAHGIECLRTLFPTGLRAALQRLQSANLIEASAGQYRAYSVQRLMAVQRIVAIEAKLGSWRVGLEQAFKNRWFASESYLLMPRILNSPPLFSGLCETGVGLLTRDSLLSRPIISARKTQLPGSYASWLFNEWACHAQNATTAIPTHDGESRLDCSLAVTVQPVSDRRLAENCGLPL